MKKIIELYKSLTSEQCLLPTDTGFDFWDDTYEENAAVYDREFVRRYSDFYYFDFLDPEGMEEIKLDLKADVLSILTLNQKKYAEMYRIFLLTDEEMPVTYNYDMTEQTGKQKNTFTKGAETDTIGQRSDTIGEITDTHKVAPFNTTTPQTESSDVTSSHTDTIGSHSDTFGQRIDTSENDAWTLTRKGNIGTQTAADVANSFVKFFDNNFKFMQMIFEDICKQMLMIGD